jgi:hypothetical protein
MPTVTLGVTSSGASGNPVTYSIVSGPGSINGTTLTITGAGTIVIAANQQGNLDYAAAPVVTESIVVLQAQQVINLTVPTTTVLFCNSSYTYGSPAVAGCTGPLAPVSELVTATGGPTDYPVTFTVTGPATIGAETCGLVATVETCTATVTFTGVGTVVVSANQGGNQNYAAAPTASQEIVVNPVPDFAISASPTPLTVSDGNLITTVISVTPEYNFNSTVALSCSGLPAGVTCSFAPASVTPNSSLSTPDGGTASSVLTITAANGTTARNSGSRPFLPLTSLAVALCFLGFRKRRNLLMLLLLAVSFVGMAMVTGCGGVSNSSSTSTTTSITVTGVATTPEGTVTHSTTFLLTVN